MNRLKQSLASIQPPSLPSFGSAAPDDDERPTAPPLHPARLASLSTRKDVAGDLADTFAQHVRTLAKQRTNPVAGSGNSTGLPSQWVGETMVEAAQEIRAGATSSTEASYAHVLASTGELYLQFTKLATSYHDQLSASYLDTLERRTDDFKDLDKTVKEADKKRSLLEAIMVKMDKGKKDPAEYERDLENAQDVYADECKRLERKADRLEEALEGDIDALKQLVEVQLDFARGYVALLEDCQSSIGGISSSSAPRPRSSTLQAPPSSTRMARSQSESSILSAPTPASSTTSGMFSMLGPNRSRRSTVSSQTSDGAAASAAGAAGDSAKNRSRSGSMLERFALGKNKKKDVSPAETPTAEEPDDEPPAQQRSGASSPSRSRIAPSMPSLGSFKKLSLVGAGSGKYGSLGEDDAEPAATTSPTSSTASFASRRVPPVLRRAETAPAAPVPSPRRAVPPLPSRGPVGKTFRAQWAYVPASSSTDHGTDDESEDELELEKGDVVRVEREVTADWWTGRVVAGGRGSSAERAQGRKGMFPSAYVVPHVLPLEADEPTQRHGAGAGVRGDDRWATTSSTSSAARDGGAYSYQAHSTEDSDSTDDNDDEHEGEQGLLDGPGASYSPFGDDDGAHAPPSRRAAPAPSLPPRGQGSSPFARDDVSHVWASGQMSRRA
ncbi:hypothetical protein JCM9279_003400 [Rhodotorula babjevae]